MTELNISDLSNRKNDRDITVRKKSTFSESPKRRTHSHAYIKLTKSKGE